MEGPTTIISDPVTGAEKRFTFDYSYWSFASEDKNFIDNNQVYKDLGEIVLNNAWGGYNCCLFAYGQTGAGKSYSMVGYGSDRGIVPQAMEHMFLRIEKNDNPNVSYQVEASMMEIYNEKVRDLFNPKNNPPGGLKVRDHPKLGPYVEDLSAQVVSSYEEIERFMAEGTKARTVASTNMNNTSSRAHTIFQIVLTTTTFDETTKKKSNKVSKINLVDLAGSERISKTGAKGATLKEGININKSLTALGNCIEKLAKRAKDSTVHVPYRNSILTWLLKQSLGGNSRTIMIAAISPASDNYDESVSTLRYADRAKQIQNKAIINEDENAKIIRALKKEIDALKAQLQGKPPGASGMGSSGGAAVGLSEEEVKKMEEEHAEFEAMKERMRQNEEIMKRMNMTWEEKMKESQALMKDKAEELANESRRRKTTPHITNLHQDMLMAESVAYFFGEGLTRLVRKDVDPPPGPTDVVLQGLLIQKDHAVVNNTGTHDGKVTIQAREGARVFVNGELIKEERELVHNDRIIIGAHHVFKYIHPLKWTDEEVKQMEDGSFQSPFDWQFAQKELTEKAMSSLSPIIDEKAQKEKEAAEAKMKELEIAMEEEKKKAEEVSAMKQAEFEKKVAELEAQRLQEMELVKQQIEAEQDAKTQEELQKRLEEQQQQMELEKKQAEELFTSHQEEMKAKQEELEKELRNQQELTNQLQRKREIENRDKVLLEESLMHTIPMVNEANAMCDELKQTLRFSIKLLARKSVDANAFTEKTEVNVKVVDAKTGVEVFWDQDQFNETLFMMRELYNDYLESGDISIDEEDNPFILTIEGPQLLGNCRIYLQPNYYLFPIDEKTPIIDYKGESCGQLHVKLLPVPQNLDGSDAETDAGGEDDGLFFDEESVEELKGEMLELRLEMPKAMGLPSKFSYNVHCEYKFFLDEKDTKTRAVEDVSINPVLGYKRTILIDPVTEDFIEYLKSGLMEIHVFGQAPPSDHKPKALAIKKNDEIAKIENLLQVHSPTGSKARHSREVSVSERIEGLLEEHEHLRVELEQTKSGSNSPTAGPRRTESMIEREVETKYKTKIKAMKEQIKEKDKTVKSLSNDDTKALVKQMKAQEKELAELRQKIAEMEAGGDVAGTESARTLNKKLVHENEKLKEKLSSQKNSKACTIL